MSTNWSDHLALHTNNHCTAVSNRHRDTEKTEESFISDIVFSISFVARRNMAAEDQPPSVNQIETVRNEMKEKMSRVGEEIFDKRDVDKLMSDDGYLSRFWIHAFFIPGDRVENTTNLIIDTFKWRKEFGVNDITV